MSNGDLLHTIKEAVEDGKIPDRVANKLLFVGQIALYKKLEEWKAEFMEVKQDVADIKKCQKDFPSVTWLLVHKPKATIFWMVVILTVLLILLPYAASVFV